MDIVDKFFLTIISLLVALMIFTWGGLAGRDTMREEAVKRGVAEYNSQNGKWQWKESKQP